MINSKQNGYGLVEVIIVSTIGIMVFLGVSGCLNSFLKVAILNIDNTEALFLAKSSLEQARAVRDEDWSNIYSLDRDEPYYFKSEGANPEKWVAQAGTKTEDGYAIWIVISKVQRDNDGNIFPGGATDDEDTLKITSNVSWSAAGGAEQINLFQYLTNFR